MGFMQADMPPVDPAKLEDLPTLDRMKMLAQHWVDYGFGGPKVMHAMYLVKGVVFILGGWLVIGVTSGLPMFDLGAWSGELVVLQKAVLWVVLWSATGFNESWGPLAFKFNPNTAGYRYWIRTGTLRLPPWPGKVPGTAGTVRKPFDAMVYVAMLVVLFIALVMSPEQTTAAAAEGTNVGLLPAWPFLTYIALQIVLGLRDKVAFLASRPEQYSVVLLGFGALTGYAGGVVDMVVVAKIAMFAVWWGAFVSKIGRHFTPTVAIMLTNAPWLTSKKIRRSLFRNAPEDMLPSRVATFFAHVLGTTVEFVLPLVILFSTNWTLTLLATIGFIVFHLFIYSMFALAMPQEWNLFYCFYTPIVFLGFFNGNGYALWDATSAWVVVVALVATLGLPLLGNFRPDLVSFLLSMRQYAGNWSSAMMAFRIGSEDKLDNPEFITEIPSPKYQLTSLFGEDVAEIFLQKAAAFRMTQTQGRGHMSIFQEHVDDLDNYRFREGEVMCTFFVGWQFGDGHLFDHKAIAGVQERCHFEPGEWVTVWTESQPLHSKALRYQVIDAALGVVETGWYDVADAVAQQPWLPDGPIPYTRTWRREGYEPPGNADPVEAALVGASGA